MNGSNPGHCFVMPKNHYPIIEQVPDTELGKLFQASNKISSAIFESLGTSGTNIFVANGIAAGQTVAHVTINVVPRKESDGVNLQWHPRQLNEEEMSTVELRLKEQTKSMGSFEKGGKKEMPNAKEPASVSADEEEFYARQMRRIP